MDGWRLALLFASVGLGSIAYGARRWLPPLASRHGAGIASHRTEFVLSAVLGIGMAIIAEGGMLAIGGGDDGGSKVSTAANV